MTTTQNNTGFKSFTATAVAIGEGIRVKLDSNGLISAAGATDAWIGTTLAAIAASGKGTVKLRNAPGTLLFTASAAIAVGAKLYPTASGKVDDAAGTGNFTGFQAVEEATADGDIFEAVPCDTLAFTAAAAQAALTENGGAIGGANDSDIPNLTATVDADIGAFTDPPSAAEMALLRTFVNALKADNVALRAGIREAATTINALRTGAVNAAIIKGSA